MMKKIFSLFVFSVTSILFCHAQTDSTRAKVLFDRNKPFEIIHLQSGITSQSSSQDTGKCRGWTISPTDLPKIISDCKPITGEDWHHFFDVLPCILSGQLKQEGQVFKFEINGGSWIWVFCDTTTLLLGNFKKENEKYFISGAWDGK